MLSRYIAFFILIAVFSTAFSQVVVYEYEPSDTTCTGQAVMSYLLPSSCSAGWSATHYNYAMCNSSASAYVTELACSSSTCDIMSCIPSLKDLNSCITSGLSPRGRSGPYKYRCTDSFAYSPQNVVLVYNQTSSGCSAIYGSFQVYKTSKCVDNELFVCNGTGVSYSRWSQNGCTGSIYESSRFTYKSCNFVNQKSISVERCAFTPENGTTPPPPPPGNGSISFVLDCMLFFILYVMFFL